MPSSSLYETDFYAWTQAQVSLLKAQQWEQLDPANLIEEIETLGRKERQELRNRLDRLLAHLLKRQFRSRSNSWSGMIREQRVQIRLLIQDSPSLKPYLEQGFADAYELGLSFAIRETELSNPVFPEQCPYLLDQVLNPQFWSEQGKEFVR